MKIYVYIMCNKRNNVLYVGMTDNICRRVMEHKLKVYEGFTSKYNVDKLVYYEIYDSSDMAANREKQLKAGSRAKKICLIDSQNQDWHDLFSEVCN